MNPAFAVGHRNKRSLGVNLRTPEGVEVIKKLAERSAVVLSNFKPGTLEKLGLGYDVLSQLNPELIWMSSSGFGEEGPRREWLGYGPLARSASGLTSLWRHLDDPAGFGESTTIYPDHFAGCANAVVVMAALIRRLRQHMGADIRTAQVETAINHIADRYAEEALRPGSDVPCGNISPEGAPWNVYPCRGDDEWCVVTVTNDLQWIGLRQALGDPNWAANPVYATAAGRLSHRGLIDAHLRAWTSGRTPQQVMDALQAHGVPAGAMRRAGELLGDPYIIARNCVASRPQPGLPDPVLMETAPFWSARVLIPDMRPAPLPGQHTEDVCRTVLEMTDDEIATLVEKGVLERPDADRGELESSAPHRTHLAGRYRS
jgi:crotonobetainyl-CoA:carnitine CoA-transferase CaiB-like acyl-CoA transferase